MMSRNRTASDDAIAVMPIVNTKSHANPSGSKTARAEITPAAAVATNVPSAGTTRLGSEAMTPARGNAKRGQGVNRTSWKFVIKEAVPIVIAAWKNDHTIRPERA